MREVSDPNKAIKDGKIWDSIWTGLPVLWKKEIYI